MDSDFNLNPKPVSSSEEVFSWENCLCHQAGNGGTLTQFTDVSWRKLQESAEIRRDEVFNNLENRWHEGPRGFYHRTCYQIYTHKRMLERLRRKRDAESSLPENSASCSEEPKSKRLSRATIPYSQLEKCLICQDEKLLKGDRRRTEPLSECQTFQASQTLQRAAEIRKDERILVAIKSQDLIALEIKYHGSCYSVYTQKNRLENLQSSPQLPSFEETESYDIAFEVLANEINEKVIVQLDVMRMSAVRDRFIELLQEKGVTIQEYRTEKLKKRVVKRFGDIIDFWRPSPRNEAEFIFANTVQKGQIIEAGVSALVASSSLLQTPTIDADADETSKLYQSAKCIRNALKSVVSTMPWPPSAEDLTEDKICVPTIVYNFLVWIMSDKDNLEAPTEKRIPVPELLHRRVVSISQDLLFTTSNGRVKPPKHVDLPMTVKNLTGSSQLITILNRFGHGLSYSHIQEIESAVAESLLDRQTGEVFVPSNTLPNVFSVFCWDNNDINEETLTGRDTTHCTNGIIIQRKVDSCMPYTQVQRGAKTKQRSVAAPQLPATLPYNPGKRTSLANVIPVKVDMFNCLLESQIPAMEIDFGWFLARLSMNDSVFEWDSSDVQDISGWTPFNAKLREDNVPRQSSVGYCQVIDASPTDLATVYTVLKKSVAMADQLQQRDVVVVFDQAIYAKALEVIWKHPLEFERVVLRMGAFHTACTMLSVIGKRFGDAGLADILIESEIVGTGSVSGVLDGKHNNRALRVHKVVLEALLRLRWQSYGQSLGASNSVAGVDIQKVIAEVHNVRSSCSAETFQTLLHLPDFTNLMDSYNEFIQDATSPMARFWNSYIDMVLLLLRFIRATREGNWELHLSSLASMIPWFFAYDRINYARYTPVYLSHMLLLEETHPVAYNKLRDGEFAVQRSSENGFGQVAVDQTIEQTLNRDTKTKGGIIGFSLRKGAVQRWIVTAHIRAAVSQSCREMAGLIDDSTWRHTQASKPRVDKDETDVQHVMSVICNFTNPFDAPQELHSLASGIVASEALSSDLLETYAKGENEMNSFVEKRLQANEIEFCAPLTKLKLKTFTSEEHSRSVKPSGHEIQLKADRNLFARLLVIAQSRNLNLREVMKHELGPFPWSLARPDGSLGKTMKSMMMDILEKEVDPIEHIPDVNARIIDGMALFQALTNIPSTFSELASLVLNIITNGLTRGKSRVDFVTDQYPTISIKNTERKRRSSGGILLFKITSGLQKCPRQWKKFLSDGKNKTALVEFLFKEWCDPRFADALDGIVLYVAHGALCHKVTSDQGEMKVDVCNELQSTQEEADTRMLLHASHAARNGCNTIIIRIPDVDVEILAVYACMDIPARLIIQTGTRNRARFVCINEIAAKLGNDICNALVGLHAFTGCDSTSSFSGHGKKKAFDLISSNNYLCETMQNLGVSFIVSDELKSSCKSFVCEMYGQCQGVDVNDLRYKLLCNKRTESHLLPPTEDALELHILRVNYQAAIWRRTLEPIPNIPSPDGHGWKIKDGALEIHWMTLSPAPQAVMQLLSCSCKGHCENKKCSCRSSELNCTDACKCDEKCQNRVNNADNTSDDSDEDED